MLMGGGAVFGAINFSVVAFRFAVTPALLAAGLANALLMGLAGGLLPAMRAERRPVAAGLRAG